MKAYEIQTNLDAVQSLAEDIAYWATLKGFWTSTLEAYQSENGSNAVHDVAFLKLEKSQKLMLVVTELAECVEGIRADADSKIEGFSNEEEEIADAMIRLLDYAGHYHLRIGEAIGAKMAKNEKRPYKHGKAF